MKKISTTKKHIMLRTKGYPQENKETAILEVVSQSERVRITVNGFCESGPRETASRITAWMTEYVTEFFVEYGNDGFEDAGETDWIFRMITGDPAWMMNPRVMTGLDGGMILDGSRVGRREAILLCALMEYAEHRSMVRFARRRQEYANRTAATIGWRKAA